LGLPAVAEQALWFAVVAATIAYFSRNVLDLRLRFPLGTLLLGVGVFVLWVAPDALFPGYRTHWLFSNSITGAGAVGAGIPEAERTSLAVLLLRGLRASLLVPILEELFWRNWLMRWLIKPEFESVPLGTYATQAFWIVAVLFAAEHGPYWDVGLACGILYNWWMVRTKSLGDLIWAHGITNACLSLYVVLADKWEYWG
jgi:CAAX prenyl protease-like protein